MPYTADQFKNNATSRIIGGAAGGGTPFNAGDTTLTIIGGDGARFSATSPFMLAVGNLAGTYELMQCTNRTGDVFTVIRGQEGTLAQAWPLNTLVSEVITAGSINDVWRAINLGRSYNVLDYGAKGDGATDDTVAIQAAITACCNSGGGEVLFPDPQATYLISSTLTVTSDNVNLRGQGWGAQLLAAPSWTSGSYMLQVQGPGGAGNFRYGIRISELFFNGNNVAGVYGLDLVSTYAAYLDHLRLRFIKGINVHWDGISGAFGAYNYMTNCHITDGGDASIGVQTDNSEWLTIQGGEFGFFNGTSGTAEAIRLSNLNCKVLGTSFDHNDTAIHLSFAGRNIIDGCQFDRGYKYYVYAQGAKESVISNNFFGVNSSAGGDLLRFDSGSNSRNIVIANTVETASNWGFFIHEYSGIGTASNLYTNNQVDTLPSLYLTGRNGNGVYNVREFGAQGDGSTDDAQEIQAAINIAGLAGGGQVLLPAGTYRTSVPLVMTTDNIQLMGQGKATTIQPLANFSGQALIYYGGAVSGNGINRTSIQNLRLWGGTTNVTTNPAADGIQLNAPVQDTLISGVQMDYLNGWAVSVLAGSSGFIGYTNLENVVSKKSAFGFRFVSQFPWANRTGGINMTNCVADDCKLGDSYLFDEVIDNVISNCQGYSNNSGGASLHIRGSAFTFFKNLDLGGGGSQTTPCVWLESGSQHTNDHILLDNVLIQKGQPGLLVNAASHLRVTGSDIFFNQNHGIQINDHTANGAILITGNQFYQNGRTATTGSYEIYNLSTHGSLTIRDNTFETTVANTTQAVSASIASPNFWQGLDVQGNNFLGGNPVTSPSPIKKTIFRNNAGYNPVGSLVAPTLNSSGVSVQNDRAADVSIFLTGSSVQSVFIGGVSTGATTGWFRLPAIQTITVNFTGTPAWSWFGD